MASEGKTGLEGRLLKLQGVGKTGMEKVWQAKGKQGLREGSSSCNGGVSWGQTHAFDLGILDVHFHHSLLESSPFCPLASCSTLFLSRF